MQVQSCSCLQARLGKHCQFTDILDLSLTGVDDTAAASQSQRNRAPGRFVRAAAVIQAETLVETTMKTLGLCGAAAAV